MKRNKDTQVERKWKIEDIGLFFANSLKAMVKGEFLLRLKIDKYFLHIAYTFFLLTMFILFSLGVDNTLNKIENNKKEIKELQILHTQKSYELISLRRRSTVSSLLQDKGSKVTEPTEPANIIK